MIHLESLSELGFEKVKRRTELELSPELDEELDDDELDDDDEELVVEFESEDSDDDELLLDMFAGLELKRI